MADISKTWTISAEEGRQMASEMKAKAQAERTAVEALAEAWASIDGRSDEFWSDSVFANAFRAEAIKLQAALHARGYRLVPEVPTAWMKDCLRIWLGREFRVFPSDRMLDAVCRDMLQVQAAPGAPKEEEESGGPSTD